MINKKRLYNFGMLNEGGYGIATLEEIIEMEKESAIYSCSLATSKDLEWWICAGGDPFEGELLELADGIYWWVDEEIIGGDFCGYIKIKGKSNNAA